MGRRKRSEQEWLEIVEAYESSGLSLADFARSWVGLSAATLGTWLRRRRLESEGGSVCWTDGGATAFVQVPWGEAGAVESDAVSDVAEVEVRAGRHVTLLCRGWPSGDWLVRLVRSNRPVQGRIG
jgi:transposase-like protein